MDKARRSNEVDTIRMAALIGICVVNVPFMSLPMETVFVAPDALQDKMAAFLVECFLQLKFFILFSFIFGWGMAVQAKSTGARQQNFARRYFRRLAGLAFLGVCHAVFVFSGDILLLYAILGSLLWLVKDHAPATLIKTAAWMVPLSMLGLTFIAFAVEPMVADNSVSFSTPGGPSLAGEFIETTQTRLHDWLPTVAFLFLLQGPLAFGAFVTGLAAAKTDFFHVNSHGFTLLKQRLPCLLLIAIPLNLLYAAVVGGIVPATYEILSLLGFIMIAIGAPALSFIYLYLFICISRQFKIPLLLVLAGRNSLSSYVAQGVLTGFVFGAYGFGQFGAHGHAVLIPVSLFIATTAMLVVGIFARYFGRGPLEPILRKISGG